MNSYETVMILAPALSAEEADKIVDKSQAAVQTGGGTVLRVDKMGRKKMAYSIGRQTEGNYVLIAFQGAGPAVAELERTLRQTESALRFVTSAIHEPKKVLTREERRAARGIR